MKDIRANYVCTVCSQTFTRKYRGKIHNINLHLGMAPIVRLIDYIIGRIEGRYQPSDPLLYRRRNKITNRKNANTVNEVSPSRFTVMPDKTKESSQNDSRFDHKHDSFHVTLNNIRPKMDSVKETNQSRTDWGQRKEAVYQKTPPPSYETSASRHLRSIVKFQEFAYLVQKHSSKDRDAAKELLCCANMLGPEKLEQDGWIDSALAFLRNYDKIT
jgi:hypothetical protein